MFRNATGEMVNYTKGTYGDRTVRLVPKALELIRTAKQFQKDAGVSDQGFIFSMNEKPLLYSAVAKAFYKYCKDLGIAPKSSHKARKTYVSVLHQANVNDNTIREEVGHKDLRTTLNNYCYDTNEEDYIYNQIERALDY